MKKDKTPNKFIKFLTPKKIILLLANIGVIIFLIFRGLMYRQNDLIIFHVIIGELIFLIMSLIVYYLSVIADAVGKMAKNCEKDDAD